MSHCAPEATLKPKRFEFTPKTAITDVFVAQVYWEAVPKTWLRSPNVLCVGGRAEPTSWTFRKQVYVVSQVGPTEVPGRTKTSKRNMPRNET